MAWRGYDQHNIWVACSQDGMNQSPQVELQDRATQSGPALSITNNAGTNYDMIWRGLDQDNIWTSSLKPSHHICEAIASMACGKVPAGCFFVAVDCLLCWFGIEPAGTTMNRPTVSRRKLLKTSAATGAGVLAAPLFVPASAWGANERIEIGVIGTGVRGKYLIANMPRIACEVDRDARDLSCRKLSWTRTSEEQHELEEGNWCE